MGTESSKKALVIDDDVSTAAVLAACVPGLPVVSVADCERGVALAMERAPRLIVLNADLLNGWTLCRRLKKDATLKDVPLIVVSALATAKQYLDHGKTAAHADLYLHKPIAPTDLARFVAERAIAPPPEEEPDVEIALDEDVMDISDADVEEVEALLPTGEAVDAHAAVQDDSFHRSRAEVSALKMQRLKDAAELDTLRSEVRRLRAQNAELTESLERVEEALQLANEIVNRHRELWDAAKKAPPS